MRPDLCVRLYEWTHSSFHGLARVSGIRVAPDSPVNCEDLIVCCLFAVVNMRFSLAHCHRMFTEIFSFGRGVKLLVIGPVVRTESR